MSRSNDIPKVNGLDHSPVTDAPPDAAHGCMAREAALREMDKFRGPAAYKTRKLVGRRSKLQASVVDEEKR